MTEFQERTETQQSSQVEGLGGILRKLGPILMNQVPLLWLWLFRDPYSKLIGR